MKKIKIFVIEFLRDNTAPLLLSTILFLASFFGTIAFQIVGRGNLFSKEKVVTLDINVSQNAINWVEIFMHNFIVLLLVLLGILTFGFISFWYIILQGYLLGITISSLLQEFPPI
jgi:stage II sporulation protein M